MPPTRRRAACVVPLRFEREEHELATTPTVLLIVGIRRCHTDRKGSCGAPPSVVHCGHRDAVRPNRREFVMNVPRGRPGCCSIAEIPPVQHNLTIRVASPRSHYAGSLPGHRGRCDRPESSNRLLVGKLLDDPVERGVGRFEPQLGASIGGDRNCAQMELHHPGRRARLDREPQVSVGCGYLDEEPHVRRRAFPRRCRFDNGDAVALAAQDACRVEGEVCARPVLRGKTALRCPGMESQMVLHGCHCGT
jgi:hypothetical protein